jgi:hypothetical protein
MRALLHRRRWLLALSLTMLTALAAAVYAIAGHQDSVVSYTGCLAPSQGTLSRFAVGDAPKSACPGGSVQMHVSGGDISAVRTPSGSGLTGGGENGAVSLGVSFAGSGSATTVARSDHTHAASAITSGTLALARIPQGPGSGLDADTLDGKNSTDFLPADAVAGSRLALPHGDPNVGMIDVGGNVIVVFCGDMDSSAGAVSYKNNTGSVARIVSLAGSQDVPDSGSASIGDSGGMFSPLQFIFHVAWGPSLQKKTTFIVTKSSGDAQPDQCEVFAQAVTAG